MKAMELTPTVMVVNDKVAFVDKCKKTASKLIHHYMDFCKFVKPI